MPLRKVIAAAERLGEGAASPGVMRGMAIGAFAEGNFRRVKRGQGPCVTAGTFRPIRRGALRAARVAEARGAKPTPVAQVRASTVRTG